MLGMPDDLEDLFVDGVRSGRYSLLLGAGFSFGSSSSDGRALPLGDILRDELAARFSLDPKYPLSQLIDAIDPVDLNTFFQSRLAGCKASESAKLISKFVWQYIFSLNIDDVLEHCYASASALQRPVWFTHRSRFEPKDDLGDVQVAYLHGSVRAPKDGYVFSAHDYGGSAASDSVWMHVAADQIAASPLIVVGCQLSEPDLEYYLARRARAEARTKNVAPSIFVNPAHDPVIQKRVERFGFIHIQRTAADFFTTLDASIGGRKTPAELIIPRLGTAGFLVDPPERSKRIFFRQWSLVNETDLPQEMVAVPNLLRGIEPRWTNVLRQEDVIRSDVAATIREVSLWSSAGDKLPHVRLIESLAGEGKSTLMMRLAIELSRSGHITYYFSGLERLAQEEAFEVLSRSSKPPILLIDNVAEHAAQTSDLVRRLIDKGIPLYLIGADRKQRMKRIQDALVDIPFVKRTLRPLTRLEALALVAKLRQEGLLGLQASNSDDELASRATDGALVTAILKLVGSGASIADLVLDEWKSLTTIGQRIYGIAAIAHALGYSLRQSIVLRAAQTNSGDFFSSLRGELAGLVLYRGPMGEAIETRHRVISEALLHQIPLSDLYDFYVSLARAVAPYCNREALIRGTVESRLAGRLFDFDDTVRPLLRDRARQFFVDVVDEWKWNSRYWEQRALMELASNIPLALKFAEQAAGIDRHPFPLTTLAKVRLAFARVTRGEDMLRHVSAGLAAVQEAIDSFKNRRRDPYPFDVAIRGMTELCDTLSRDKPPLTLPGSTIEVVERLIEKARASHLYRQGDLKVLEDRWQAARDTLRRSPRRH